CPCSPPHGQTYGGPVQTDDPARFQPALTWWGHTWRVLAAVAIGALLWADLAVWQWQHLWVWFWIDLALGMSSVVAMQYRRRWPLAAAAYTILACLFSASSGGPATVVLASVATRRRSRETVGVFIASVIQALLFEWFNPVNTEPYVLLLSISVVY